MVTLSHGSGGQDSAYFTNKIFLPFFKDLMPYHNEDSGIFNLNNKLGITSTDSYIINPIFFRGGDIGKLSICGSSNDVTMMGAKPLFINIGFIIEEGFAFEYLKKIANSISIECKKLDIKILSADTKVLPKLSNDKESSIFINTSCIGELIKSNISSKHLRHGDCIIVSGKIGNHGASIFLEQNNIEMQTNLQSDCASLYPMLEKILYSDFKIHALRDATRGGLSSVLNEWAIESRVCININESEVPVDSEVLGVCEILGLEPYALANEGVCVISAPKDNADSILELLRAHENGKEARIIGEVSKNNLQEAYLQKVILNTEYGSKRFLEYPSGELLPRIC